MTQNASFYISLNGHRVQVFYSLDEPPCIKLPGDRLDITEQVMANRVYAAKILARIHKEQQK